VPLVLATTTYAVVALGWVARPAFYYPASITTPISAYLSTLDVRALALVAVNVGLAAIIYFPFVRAYERDEVLRQAQDDPSQVQGRLND
jgi:cellobiose PTS system EIIC component